MNARNMCLSSPLFFTNYRGDCREAAGPHLPAGLGEQQRGPQHRQHAEHALLQQQHGLAPPPPPPPRARPDGTGGRTPERLDCGSFVKREWISINITCCIHPPTQGESPCAPWTSVCEKAKVVALPTSPSQVRGLTMWNTCQFLKCCFVQVRTSIIWGPEFYPGLKELVKGWQADRTREMWPKIPL